MRKEDLKRTVFGLATDELCGRLLFERFSNGDPEVTENSLNLQQQRIDASAEKARLVRAQIPELSQKAYWWDDPFDIRKPSTEFPGTLSLALGIYSEQDDFEYWGATMKRITNWAKGSDVLTYHVRSQDGTYAPLYVNRKGLKQHLTDDLQIKEILVGEIDFPNRMSERKSYRGVVPGGFEYNQMVSNLNFVNSQLPGSLAAHEEKWDNRERFRHLSFYTNEERWFRYEMSNDDYYQESLWRDLERQDIIDKARARQAELQYKIQRARAEYARNVMENAQRQKTKGPLLRFMRCGRVFYYGDEVMAITIRLYPEALFEAHYSGTVSLLDIHGYIDGCREAAACVPDPLPLMDFILETYAPSLPRFNLLGTRPAGTPERLWRCWCEKRFAWDVLQYGAPSV